MAFLSSTLVTVLIVSPKSLSMMELLKNVVLKPNSQTTTARLDASVINEILGTSPPKVTIDYLTNTVCPLFSTGMDPNSHSLG